MYYTLVSQSGNNYTYAVTLKLYRDPTSGAPLDANAAIAVFDRATNTMVWNSSIPMSNQTTITLSNPGPCIINPPFVSYNIGYYNFNVTLPSTQMGYIISYQRCCRVNTLTNVTGSGSIGATYTAQIPGFEPNSSAPSNNSPRFLGVDTVVICSGYPFTYNFEAEDPDADSLSYSFCDAYLGGAPGNAAPNPPGPPPYSFVPYTSPYSGVFPLGTGVSINTNTGLITGTAPAVGVYVVTVCVQEWRNGVLIATQRKDLQVKVADCNIAAATLNPNYITCDGFTMTFSNLTPNPLINSYFWDFGVPSILSDTSNLPSPTYTYPDTGIYIIKLVTNRNQPCSDSTTAQVAVYPGFFPDFTSTGVCVNTPVQFTDQTVTNYGTVNFWRWDFGNPSVLNDTSRLQNPQYTYNTTNTYTVQLIVGNSKGCRDTITRDITIIDKPLITMPFNDTLICSIDTIQLQAAGNGAFTWTPNYNILNATSATPLVFPKVTTWYKVDLNDNGCRNQDSIRVRVVDSVTLSVANDTTICLNDAAQLYASTNGFQYSWSPAANLSDPNILFPIATPPATTVYQLTSQIGRCSNTKNVTVRVAPRPFVNAGPDTTICFSSSARLNGQHNGTSFSWSSPGTLNNPSILNPVASPSSTTTYILTVNDNTPGNCPKPSYDTVVVNVLPEVVAFAGRDTTIIAGLPFQMLASGGQTYSWSPATGLSDPNIANPVAMLDGNPGTITYTVQVADQAGCTDNASITVKVFKTGPDIFVPTGFTPNADGRNDVFRPIYVGMKQIDYFRVYNRWGQLIYSSSSNDGKGWDGTIGGKPQNSGVFIWMVSATDILDKKHFKKGTVMLIR